MNEIDVLYINMIEEVNWLLNLRALGLHEFEPLFNG
jgi:hypothetical protein